MEAIEMKIYPALRMAASRRLFRRLVVRVCTTTCAALLLGTGSAFAAGGAAQFRKKPDEWFATDDAKRIAGNILSFQSDLGGWPKNTDTVDAPFKGDPKKLAPTFDNGSTTDELRFLARMFVATRDATYRNAFGRGLDYILKAQYPTGGWPQYYPPGEKYHRYITFNDNAMVRIMEFLREMCTSGRYAFVEPARREAAKAEFLLGVACILKCQIKVNGKLTAWCAQHDEKDYAPRPARAADPLERIPQENQFPARDLGIVPPILPFTPPGRIIVCAPFSTPHPIIDKTKGPVAHPLSEKGLADLHACPSLHVVVTIDIPPDGLLTTAHQYDGIVVRSQTKITTEVIAKATKLNAVDRAGVGVDNIPCAWNTVPLLFYTFLTPGAPLLIRGRRNGAGVSANGPTQFPPNQFPSRVASYARRTGSGLR